jgi:hypothetical protein
MQESRKYDELGRALCQSDFNGLAQCDGHEGHYVPLEWPHFAMVQGKITTWFDAEPPCINGLCCK